jgi:hypothetical protein
MKIPVWMRVTIIISALWSLFWVSASWKTGLRSFESGSVFELDSFIHLGLMPLVIIWGLIWIFYRGKNRGGPS